MFEQAFKNIDDVLWKEAGCTTELDYTEQTSWLLFLKYLDGMEQDKAMEARLDGKKYAFILDKDYRWESWAAPKGKDGQIDHNKALTGDDLRDFVNLKLFPYLHGFKQKASGPNTIEYKIGEIFGEIKNKIQSGYNLREIIDHIDELRSRSQTEKHELSHLYEGQDQKHGQRRAQRKLAALDALKKALLHNALNGQLLAAADQSAFRRYPVASRFCKTMAVQSRARREREWWCFAHPHAASVRGFPFCDPVEILTSRQRAEIRPRGR